jgi:hypothetical protein
LGVRGKADPGPGIKTPSPTAGVGWLGGLRTWLQRDRWWVDGAFAVHPDMKSHTGGMMSLGKDLVMNYDSSAPRPQNHRSVLENKPRPGEGLLPGVLKGSPPGAAGAGGGWTNVTKTNTQSHSNGIPVKG